VAGGGRPLFGGQGGGGDVVTNDQLISDLVARGAAAGDRFLRESTIGSNNVIVGIQNTQTAEFLLNSARLDAQATRRVVSPGVMEVREVRIRARLVDWKKADVNMLTFTGTWPTVGTWLDKSGNGNTETAVGTPQWVRSAINGKPGVQIANGSYFTSTAANLFTSGAARTVIAVCKPGTVGGRIRVFRVASPQMTFEYLANGGNTFILSNGFSTNGTLAANPTIAGVPVILQWTHDASAAGVDQFVRFRINGVDQGVVNGNVTSDTGTQGWATGSDVANQVNNLDGPICELLTFDGMLSWNEQEALYNDLASDYAASIQAPVQVLAAGDSTTAGAGDGTTAAKGGWRSYISAGRPNFQFVGGIYTPHSTFGETDNKRAWARNEGHSGKTSAADSGGIGGPQFQSYLTTAGMRPRLVMLQIGQNDPGAGIAAATTAANIADMSDLAYAIDPTIQILIMAAAKRRSNNSANNAVIVAQRALIAAAISGKTNVIGFGTPTDVADINYVDDDHTNDTGYQSRAADWDALLTSVGY